MSQYKDYSPDAGYYEDLEQKSSPANEIDTEIADATRSKRSKTRRTQESKTEKINGKDPKIAVNHNKKPTAKKVQDEDPTLELSTSLSEFKNKINLFFNNPVTKGLIGLFFFGLGAYLVVCLISFLTTGFADQSNVESLAVGNAKQVENLGGEGGARLAQLLIDDTFGIGSIVIAIWLIAISFKFLGIKKLSKFRTVNFTIKCLVALITISLIAGTATVVTDWHFNLGGAHGRYLNQELLDFVGGIGVTFVCVFMVAVFVSICLNDLVQWFLRKKTEHEQKRAEKRALIEEANRKEREKREMELQETLEQAMAGEAKLPEDTETSATRERNMEFSSSRATPLESVQNNGMPEEDDLTYVYTPQEEEAPLQEKAQSLENEEEKFAKSEEGGDDLPPMQVNVNHISTVNENQLRTKVVNPRNELADFHFPPVALLKPAEEKAVLDEAEQLENQAKIRKTLLDFGIPIVSIEATVGPTVTLYEIVPDDGVKIASIRNLVDNIALNLKAVGVRIIAPIPGKGTVGIEVANKDPRTVSMRTLITSRKYQESKYELPLAIGSTISNEVYIADLAKMPHLLVAGATGQGKSVGLNAIITSLLYRLHPAELKLVLVDPKRVEFSRYRALEHHYLAKMPGEDRAIVTDMNKVIPLLSALCVEMGNRYEKLEDAEVVNIKEYNAKILNYKLSPDDGHKFMPYIVVVVDEYADLLMTVGKEVEKPIARLAQKARAVGIHLIVATQRPSADVVTGMIKANFPSRIAFRVTNGVDSKTILNTTAAYQLIGRGDMLISTGGEPERVQCAFIDTPEVKDICNFISQQPGYIEPYKLPEPETGSEADDVPKGDMGKLDPLTKEIGREVVRLNTASTSALQRRYSIGFTRAGKIMDQLERLGVVGPAQGGKPRAVLVDGTGLEEIFSTID